MAEKGEVKLSEAYDIYNTNSVHCRRKINQTNKTTDITPLEEEYSNLD
jgi:hypothetical protein